MDSTLRNVVLQNYSQTVPIAAYVGDFSYFHEYQGNDVVEGFKATMEAGGFPDGQGYDVHHDTINEVVGQRYLDEPRTPVAVELDAKTWNAANRTVDLTITMRNDSITMAGSYWYNVIVTEDNIKKPHETLTGCSTPDTNIQPYIKNDYINMYVNRMMVHYSQGKSLVEETWPADQAFTEELSIEIDTAWAPENCNLVIHVYKKADSLYKSPAMQVIRVPVVDQTTVNENVCVPAGIELIYPNPSNGLTNIHITLKEKTSCSLNIFDLSGKKIKNLLEGEFNSGKYNIEFQSAELPAGTYLVVLEAGPNRTSQKLIVQ